jgi:ubiquinol-cytochrome c reductase cytochrome c1 subunit
MLLVGVISSSAWGAGGDVTLKTRDWSFSGPFGTFDKAAMQRGFQVYNEVCAGCHSMKLIAFRNFADLGYNEAEIKALAAQYEVQDGPNDDGEMFMRPAIPADRMPSPYANDNAARAGNNGALPPDLSLIAKARPNGPNYLYSLLSSYENAPNDKEVPDGMYYNAAYPGLRMQWVTQIITYQQMRCRPQRISYQNGTSFRFMQF